MKVRFLGATGTVTGSKYLVTTDQANLLVDCGLYQGYKNLRERNWQPFPIDVKTIDAVVLTHAHLDHSGMIPLLYKYGYRGPVYCTAATFELCKLLLPDSGHIQEEEANFRNKHKLTKHQPALPLYDLAMAEKSLKLFSSVDFDQTVTVKDLQIKLSSVGHILGAGSVRITDGNKSMVVSGDVGRPNELVMPAPKALEPCDCLLIESTYGDRLHEKDDSNDKLADVINQTISRGGSIVIPSFAIGRAQTLMFLLLELIKADKIPKIPIFLDSPMAISASGLYSRFNDLHRMSAQQCQEMGELVEYTREVEASKKLADINYPHIIISASGMATGGRVLHHLKRMLPDHRNAVIMVGYQAGGTRGRKLLNGDHKLKIFGIDVKVKAHIEEIDTLSAHADYQELILWLKQSQGLNPRQVFVVHGEPDAADSFRLHLKDQLGWTAKVPEYMSEHVI
jgi:metallo-beta-lactamase family protein